MTGVLDDLGAFWKAITGDSQLRWIGPEKGVIHLATAAVVNAVWDLRAKREGKPLWRVLCDMAPAELAACIDYRYITDEISEDWVVERLRAALPRRSELTASLTEDGVPAYTTSAGWLGYDDDKLRALCRTAVADGWTHLKMKVGRNRDDDLRRAAIIREEIGDQRFLMMDANQVWDVEQAIDWTRALAGFDPLWIEEPTSPDDVLGHARIARAVDPIGVATGEHVHNRVMFKQLLQAEAIRYCQIDAARLGGVNEVLSVLFMAAKRGVTVCPHAGGVGLCEYVQHLALFDAIAVAPDVTDRVVEYVDHLHEHFVHPVRIRDASYVVPRRPGTAPRSFPRPESAIGIPTATPGAARRPERRQAATESRGAPSAATSTSTPSARANGGRPEATIRPRLVTGDVLVRPVVHEGHREQRVRRGAGRKVRDGGRDEVSSPRIFDRDAKAEGDGEIPHQLGLREPSDLGDLQVERLHGVRLVGTEQRVDVANALVEHHRQGRPLAHDQALLERRTRLLEEDALEPVDRARRDHGVLEAPASVGIGDDDVLGAGRLDHASGAGRVLVGIGADLELKAVDSLGASRLDVVGHLLDGCERHRKVQREAIGQAPAEQIADGHPDCSTERVPTRSVDRALRIAVTHQRSVHRGVDGAEVAGVDAESPRVQARARAARAPAPCAGRYAGPRGQTSPNPSTPSAVVMRTTVLGSVSITRLPDIT